MATKEPLTILTIPQEIRDLVLSYVLPSKGPVNIRPFRHRWSWMHNNKRRCDPSVLSVDGKLSTDASRVLYGREFVIDVNCGHRLSQTQFDRAWGSWKLANHFPFQKARQITLRIGSQPASEFDHVVDHMIYFCGHMFSKPDTAKKLAVEIHTSQDDWNTDGISLRCGSFLGTWFSRGAYRAASGFESPTGRIGHIATMLHPLSLCEQLADLFIRLPEMVNQNNGLQEHAGYYKLMATAPYPEPMSGSEEYKAIHKRFLELVDEENNNQAAFERSRQIYHSKWLTK
ncbi:MAG: hypothetical protein Q9218_004857, partial [Villophora microphyllina]